MTLSVTDLFTAQSADTIRAQMVVNLGLLGIPADQWRKGGVASTILTVTSVALALLSDAIASIITGLFLPTATGNNLTLLAQYVYGVTVPDATFASGNVTLTNAGGGSYTIAIGGLVVQNPTSKVTYTNDAAFTLGPGATLNVNVIATTAGAAGSSAAGTILVMVTSLLLVSVTNATALVGVDRLSDSDIRTLCLNRLGALSVRGPRTAYAYATQTALNSVTGDPVNINRWAISSASHTGAVTLVVASPSGAPAADDVTGVTTNVEAIARPEGVTAIVTPATAVSYAPTLVLWTQLPAGVTATTAKAAVDAALVAMISRYPIGGVTATDDANPSTPITGLFASAVYGVCASAIAGLGGSMVSAKGATDIVLTSTQVATNGITTSVQVLSPTSGAFS